ncbi:hypothetical protein BDV12DRAFT_210099 [Aspergillus spectabilis]
MSSIPLSPTNLLIYNSKYKVLVCRECKYAIQKPALRSHLLRHKIYREKRQRLLSSIAELDILEPDLVATPGLSSAPVDGLPIISGYQCSDDECGYLCASLKRMRMHWRDVHGVRELESLGSWACPVKIQTFFRGTKIRYFEVRASETGATDTETGAHDDDDDNDDDNDNDDYNNGRDEKTQCESMKTQVPRLQNCRESSNEPSPPDIDLQTMIYFHHFITTSCALPNHHAVHSGVHYWQVTVVSLALRHKWLMHGLLAISACHMAALADDQKIRRIHHKRATRFFTRFSNGLETIIPNPGMAAAGLEDGTRKAGSQIRGILSCALGSHSQVHSIMNALRDTVSSDSLFSQREARYDDNHHQQRSFAEASNALKTRAHSSTNSIASGEVNRLCTLPSLMAEILGKPDRTDEVLTTLSAIAALVDCCTTSLASDELEAVWRSMTTWLIKVPGQFHDMVAQHRPAALVVVAHWAAFLVKRAEQCGCWFLEGLSRRALLHIGEELPAEDIGIQSLITGLIS